MAEQQPSNRKPSRSAESARRRMQRSILSEWRGIYVPPDLSGYERKVGDIMNVAMDGFKGRERVAFDASADALGTLASP